MKAKSYRFNLFFLASLLVICSALALVASPPGPTGVVCSALGPVAARLA
jgi:hypothetical protein